MNKKSHTIVVVGAGAAGVFASIHSAILSTSVRIILLEEQSRSLQKVKISGGGRCNVTHACFDVKELVKNYPRGGKILISAFHQFMTNDTIKWFEERGVSLKTEADGRIFPKSDSSQSIIDCLMNEIHKHNIELCLSEGVNQIIAKDNNFTIETKRGRNIKCDKLILCIGGQRQVQRLHFLESLGHQIIPPVPSLFTFNIPDSALHKLAGITLPHVQLRLFNHKMQQTGSILITHWGISGPAVLRLSSWAAREIASLNYNFPISISWLGTTDETKIYQDILYHKNNFRLSKIAQMPFGNLPKRFFEYLCRRASVDSEKRWADISNFFLSKLARHVTSDIYEVKGKTTFKEEFVTCGGVACNEINFQTMESKKIKGLYFAGEILDIDGITGGFNFQSAWTTGFIAGRSAGSSIENSLKAVRVIKNATFP